jgi:nucleoid-associated protein YgaU
LGAALLIAFFVGRASAPGGVSKGALDKVKTQLSDAQQQIQTLQAQAAAAVSASPAPSGSASPSATPAAAAGSQTYTVKPGDTLRGIAQKFYGDSSLATVIEQANNITDPSQLRSGETITIPPKP